jgi:outer membrane protein
MKKLVVILTGLFFLLSVGNLFALNIAYVDLEKISSQYKGVDKLKKKLEDEAKKESTKFEAKEKSIMDKIKELDKQKSVLDKKILEQKTADVQAEYKEIQADKYKYMAKLEAQKNELLSNMVEEIKAVVQKIAKEKAYDYVLVKDALLAGGEDITYLVLKKMNEE